jgi:hypothetical protein
MLRRLDEQHRGVVLQFMAHMLDDVGAQAIQRSVLQGLNTPSDLASLVG